MGVWHLKVPESLSTTIVLDLCLPFLVLYKTLILDIFNYHLTYEHLLFLYEHLHFTSDFLYHFVDSRFGRTSKYGTCSLSRYLISKKQPLSEKLHVTTPLIHMSQISVCLDLRSIQRWWMIGILEPVQPIWEYGFKGDDLYPYFDGV